jgi:hypothetical protein
MCCVCIGLRIEQLMEDGPLLGLYATMNVHLYVLHETPCFLAPRDVSRTMISELTID